MPSWGPDKSDGRWQERERERVNYVLSLELVGGARGVMVITVGDGHDDTSSNPGRGCLHFT